MSNLSSVAQNRDLVQNSIVVNIQNPQPGTGVADPNPNPVVPAGQSDVGTESTVMVEQPLVNVQTGETSNVALPQGTMGRAEQTGSQVTDLSTVETAETFFDSFKTICAGNRTTDVKILGAGAQSSVSSQPSNDSSYKIIYELPSKDVMSNVTRAKLTADWSKHRTDLGGFANNVMEASRVDNSDTHRVTVRINPKTNELYQAGWNGKKWLCFNLESGDKVGTHEYANGKREIKGKGTFFLRVDKNSQGLCENRFKIDSFLKPITFKRADNALTETSHEYTVKDQDAGYRFTHANKKSTESNPKDMDELKLEAVGAGWKPWKSVFDRTGMNDPLMMKAVRGNFGMAVYDELSFGDLIIPSDDLEKYVMNTLQGVSPTNADNQNASLILRKSEVARTVQDLTEAFMAGIENAGRANNQPVLFNNYVRENICNVLSQVTKIRCTPANYESVLKNLLGDNASDWTPEALFASIRNETQKGNIDNALMSVQADALRGKSATEEFNARHEAAAKIFNFLLQGLAQKMVDFNRLVTAQSVEREFDTITKIVRDPNKFDDKFASVSQDARRKVENLLRNAIKVHIDAVKNESVKAELNRFVQEGLTIFCGSGRVGATDFLSLELQRIALAHRDKKFSMEILDEIACTAMEFINGYRKHCVEYRKSPEYQKKRAEMTKQTGVVVKALAKFVKEETLAYLGRYKDAQGKEKDEIGKAYSEFRRICVDKHLMDAKMPGLEVLSNADDEKLDKDIRQNITTSVFEEDGSQGGSVLDLNGAFDALVRDSYVNYFRECKYTGVNLFDTLKKEYESDKKAWEDSKLERKDVEHLKELKVAFITAEELKLANFKNFIAVGAQKYDTDSEYADARQLCEKHEMLANFLKEKEESISKVKDEVKGLEKKIEELKVETFKWTRNLTFDAYEAKDLTFENYMMTHDLQKDFDRSMVRMLGGVFAALTTFRPLADNQVPVAKVLNELMDSYARQADINNLHTHGLVQKSAKEKREIPIEAKQDPNRGVIGSGLVKFKNNAMSFVEALDVCVGTKSSSASFKEKFMTVFYCISGQQLGFDNGAGSIDKKIKDAISSFGLRNYSSTDSRSLFNGLYDNWMSYLLARHNQSSLDLFDDLLTINGNPSEKEVLEVLTKNFLANNAITRGEADELKETLLNLQHQIVTICTDSLKGFSTNLFNTFERHLVFDSFSGETYVKAKRFRNALTKMSDAQLWKMCTDANGTDGELPPEITKSDLKNRKTFRMTMEAICEYRFMTKSLQAIKEALYSFTEVLPRYQDSFLENRKVGSDPKSTFPGKKLNDKGIAYLKGVINNAVDVVLAEEIEKAAISIQGGDALETESVKSLVDVTQGFRDTVSGSVLTSMVVGQMFNLDAIYSENQGQARKVIERLFDEHGQKWFLSTYPVLSRVYSGDVKMFFSALKNGILNDFCNSIVLSRYAKSNALNLYDWMRQLQFTIAEDLEGHAIRQLQTFLDEVEKTLSGMVKDGKDFYLGQYDLFSKANGSGDVVDNAFSLKAFDDVLGMVGDKNEREKLKQQLIGQAVEQVLLADEKIASIVKDSMNYAKFESYRKSMSEKLKIHLKTNGHEFVKAVTRRVNTILDQVKVIINSEEFSNGLTGKDVKDALAGLVKKNSTEGKLPEVLFSHIDSTNANDSMKAQIHGALGIPTTTKADAGAYDREVFGCRRGYLELVNLNEVSKMEGFDRLVDLCIKQTREKALQDPVRYYLALSKQFGNQRAEEEGSQDVDVKELGKALCQDAADLLFRLLPKFVLLQQRVDKKVRAKMADLERNKDLLKDEWGDLEAKIRGAVLSEMIRQLGSYDDSFQKLQSQMVDDRQKLAKTTMTEAINKFNGVDQSLLDAMVEEVGKAHPQVQSDLKNIFAACRDLKQLPDVTKRLMDKVRKLGEERSDVGQLEDAVNEVLEKYGNAKLKGKTGKDGLDSSRFARVYRLEVEDALVDKMVDAVVSAAYGEEDTPYAALKGKVDKAIEKANADFISKNKAKLASLVDELKGKAASVGLKDQAQMNDFVAFLLPYLKPTDSNGVPSVISDYLEAQKSREEGKFAEFVEQLGKDCDFEQVFSADAHVKANEAYVVNEEDSQKKAKGQFQELLSSNQESLCGALKARFLLVLQKTFGRGADEQEKTVKSHLDKINGEFRKGETAKLNARKNVEEAKAVVSSAFSADAKGGIFAAIFGPLIAANATASQEQRLQALNRTVRILGLNDGKGDFGSIPSETELKKLWTEWKSRVIVNIDTLLSPDDGVELGANGQETAGNIIRALLRNVLEEGCAKEFEKEVADAVDGKIAKMRDDPNIPLVEQAEIDAVRTNYVKRHLKDEKTVEDHKRVRDEFVDKALDGLANLVANTTGGQGSGPRFSDSFAKLGQPLLKTDEIVQPQGQGRLSLEDVRKAAFAVKALYLDDVVDRVLWSDTSTRDFQMSFKNFCSTLKPEDRNLVSECVGKLLGLMLDKVLGMTSVRDMIGSNEAIIGVSKKFSEALKAVDQQLVATVIKEAGTVNKKDTFNASSDFIAECLGRHALFAVKDDNGRILTDNDAWTKLVSELYQRVSLDEMMKKIESINNDPSKTVLRKLRENKNNRLEAIKGRFDGGIYNFVCGRPGKPKDNLSGLVLSAELAGISSAYSKMKERYLGYCLVPDFASRTMLEGGIVSQAAVNEYLKVPEIRLYVQQFMSAAYTGYMGTKTNGTIKV